MKEVITICILILQCHYQFTGFCSLKEITHSLESGYDNFTFLSADTTSYNNVFKTCVSSEK